jgi:hypothetical protein
MDIVPRAALSSAQSRTSREVHGSASVYWFRLFNTAIFYPGRLLIYYLLSDPKDVDDQAASYSRNP